MARGSTPMPSSRRPQPMLRPPVPASSRLSSSDPPSHRVPRNGWERSAMMIRHSLLYLPAQIIGPLMQLVAMVVWTHLVSEHTLGVITLVIATHELLQVAFLAWWSQF